MKMCVETLAIEVTRKCNLRCAHCLRGEPQDISIDPLWYKNIFSLDFKNLLLTGGEPSLAGSQIEEMTKYLKRNKIKPKTFHIKTNGIEDSNEIIDLCKYIGDGELCISVDSWHKNNTNNSEFYSNSLGGILKLVDENNFQIMVHSGRNLGGKENCKAPIMTKRALMRKDFALNPVFDGEGILLNTIVYICANGNVSLGCDFSFEDYDGMSLGSVKGDSLYQILNKKETASRILEINNIGV